MVMRMLIRTAIMRRFVVTCMFVIFEVSAVSK